MSEEEEFFWFRFFFPFDVEFFSLLRFSHGKRERDCACGGSLPPCLPFLRSQLACESQEYVLMSHAVGGERAKAVFDGTAVAETGAIFFG